ncbi:MAG: FAD binding domain-containing protein [Flavobacteriaceae bacterium]|nr:FAD binding domain-containing protein [Flavobacteriaceae bacterium]
MIEFILNNKHIKTAEHNGITLLDFIRDNQQLKGTKIGCREGDCGACTVLIGTLQENKIVNYQSITSCISPLGNAQGKHIVTVDGTNLQDKLTTAQQAMTDNYATQCGFCTPGFVVSLTGLALKNTFISYGDGLNAISGNICRCTGYKSIEKATKNVIDSLQKKDTSNPIKWLVENNYIPKYFATIPERLTAIISENKSTKNSNYVAGGTDLYVRNADKLAEENINLLTANNELTGISFYKDNCAIGALATVTDLMYNNAMQVYFPEIQSFLKLVSSEQIRNMATLAGNFVNASPIGDMTILFLALNCNITIKNADDKLRTIALKDFYTSYKIYDLQKNEIIVNIAFEVPDSSHHFNFEKVSKRTHLDIASVNSAINIKTSGNTIENVHLAVGGVAPIPKYLHKTSAFLVNKEVNIEVLKEANLVMQKEIAPISDVRGSSDYKRLLARQLFFAHFTKLFPKKISLTELVA